jgi:hypothetical protein
MTQTCAYCDDEHDIADGCGIRLSSGFGRFNKTIKNFCSVECRAWWRRRESDLPGPWEQPHTPGYQGRLDRFRDDHDDSDERSESVSGAVEASPTSESATGNEAEA